MNYGDEIVAAFVAGELEGEFAERIRLAAKHDGALAHEISRQRTLRWQKSEAERLLNPRARAGQPRAIPAAGVPRWCRTMAFWFPVTVAAASMSIMIVRPWAAEPDMLWREGRLEASGALAAALDSNGSWPREERAGRRVGAGLARADGAHCRSFTIGAFDGLACRDGKRWVISGSRTARDHRAFCDGTAAISSLSAERSEAERPARYDLD